MGIAWKFKFSNVQIQPYFLLLHSNDNQTSNVLPNTIQNLAKPLDLWLVNFEQK